VAREEHRADRVEDRREGGKEGGQRGADRREIRPLERPDPVRRDVQPFDETPSTATVSRKTRRNPETGSAFGVIGA